MIAIKAIVGAVPAWLYVALLTLLLMAGGGWWTYSQGKAHTQALWDADKLRAESVGQKADDGQRAIETKDNTAKEENHETVTADLARARSDAAGAYAAYQRLQHEYADYLRASAASATAAAAAGESPTNPTSGVSANLLERYIEAADARARGTVEAAGFADAAHAGGASCEREYDAVRANRG